MRCSRALTNVVLAWTTIVTASPAAAADTVHVERIVAYRLRIGSGYRLFVDVTLAQPPPKDVADAARWKITTAPLGDENQAFSEAAELKLEGTTAIPQNLVTLSVDNPSCDECRVHVYLDGVFQPTSEAQIKGTKPKPLYQAAKKKEDADIYFSGAIATSQGKAANYSVDAALGGSKDAGAWGQLGARATFTVDKEPTLDPDSITVGAVWRKVVAISAGRGLIFRSNLFQGEFDREDQVRNGVSSLSATVVTGRAYPDTHTYIGLDPVVGFEFGRNFRSFSAEQDERVGRLLVGADFFYGIVRHGGTDAFTIDGEYRLRMLATNEPFTEAGHTSAIFDRSERHYLSIAATVNFTDYLGVTFSLTDGSLPPVYHSMRRKIGLGLTLKLKQRLRTAP